MTREEIKSYLEHIRKQYIESLTFHWSNIDQRAAQITTAQLLDICDSLLSELDKREEAVERHKMTLKSTTNDYVGCKADEDLYREMEEIKLQSNSKTNSEGH